ncbi:MAG TPA: PHB depolymerase family esterase [Kofleriaceae bacterium]|jgi:polyhydroxybutyrate depolymerase
MKRLLYLAALAACGSSHAGAGDVDAPAPTGDAAAPDAPSLGGPCGVRAGMRGKTSRTLQVAGLTRTYIVYLPANDDPTRRVPLVYVHHGYTMSGENMYDITGYPALADDQHIALAFPDGQGGPDSLGAPWNVGTNVCPSYAGAPPEATGDDFAFLDAMKADIAQDQCLDDDHIFVTGFSMGGYFAHQVGCMRPDIRGVAPHSGGTHELDDCPTVHKPIIIFHGTSDEVVPDGCDDPSSSTPSGYVASATAWAAKNGCAPTSHTMAVEGGTCALYDGCPADGQVELCTFDNMVHCWAGGVQGLYGCANYASATTLEWSFWQQYAW